jgi:hypothetical protein
MKAEKKRALSRFGSLFSSREAMNSPETPENLQASPFSKQSTRPNRRV